MALRKDYNVITKSIIKASKLLNPVTRRVFSKYLKLYIKYNLLYPFRYPVRKGSKSEFIFVHINKTGGTSFSEALGYQHIEHLTASEIYNIVGRRKWNSAFKFSLVRNPYDRVVSQYHYRMKTNQNNMKIHPIKFSDWLEKVYVKDFDPFYHDDKKMFMPQSEWLIHNNKLNIDYVGKFENLENSFRDVQNQIGFKDVILPHLKQSNRSHYKEYYNNRAKEVIRNWYESDLDNFKYIF